MASGKSNSYAQLVLEGIFQQVFTAITSLLANAGSPVTTLYVSLHTASPGAGGNQSTNEAAYTGYARVGVVRTSAGWSIANETVSNVSGIIFPTATGGSEIETFVGIGTAASGAGNLLYFGALTTELGVTSGITPAFAIGALTVSEN